MFDVEAENPYYHWRTVKWLNTDVPRSNFDQDLPYSFGAFMTICKIKRKRVQGVGALVAHRIAAMLSVGQVLRHIPAKRLLITTGRAG